MTNQEVFDKVVTYLRQQKRQSLSDNYGCSYRGTDGNKCAIGYLIPDELYVREMEGRTPNDLLGFKGMQELFAGLDHDLLQDLQALHDDWHPTFKSQFEDMVKYFAKKHVLTIPT